MGFRHILIIAATLNNLCGVCGEVKYLSKSMASHLDANGIIVLDVFDSDQTVFEDVEEVKAMESYQTLTMEAHRWSSELLKFKDLVLINCHQDCVSTSSLKELNDKGTFVLAHDSFRPLLEEINPRWNADIYIFTTDLAIQELYSFKGNSFSPVIGSLTETGLEFTKSREKWNRRSNFNGAQLALAHLPYYPFSYFDENESWRGYLPDIMNSMASKLNFTYKLVPPSDGEWGVKFENGSFSGLIGQAERKEVDMTVAAVSYSLTRVEKVDFSRVIYLDLVTLVTKKSQTASTNLWVYFDSMHKNAWIGTAVIMLILALGLSLIPLLSQEEQLHNRDDPETFGFLNAIALVGLNLCQRDYPILTKFISTKIMFYTICMFAFLTFSNYTAMLTSTMISKPAEVSIKNLMEVASKNIPIIVWKGTSVYDLLSQATPGSDYDIVYNKLMKNNPKSGGTSVAQMVDFLLSHDNAFAYDSSITYFGVSGVAPVKGFTSTFDSPYAFAYPKESALREMIDFHLLKMEQSGVSGKLKQKWGLKSDSGIAEPEEPSIAVALGFDNLAFPFVVLAGGIALSFLGMLWELIKTRMMCSRKKERRRRRTRSQNTF